MSMCWPVSFATPRCAEEKKPETYSEGWFSPVTGAGKSKCCREEEEEGVVKTLFITDSVSGPHQNNFLGSAVGQGIHVGF